MPEFATPEPISVIIELTAGDVRVAAGDRHDTLVEVRPSDPDRPDDVTAAELTRVEYEGGTLSIKTTRRWRSYSPFSDGGSVDVQVELPAESRLTGEIGLGAFRCTGTLGDCRIKTSLGDLQVDTAAAVKLSTGSGEVSVERALGTVELGTGSGDVRVGEADGTVVIRNSNGDARVGVVTGELRVKAANGDMAVERAHASVVAKTANGDVRLGIVTGGPIVAETARGDVEIGVPDGTATWLDLHTGYGHIENGLQTTAPPDPGEDSLSVRARSGYGDITIARAYPFTSLEPAA